MLSRFIYRLHLRSPLLYQPSASRLTQLLPSNTNVDGAGLPRMGMAEGIICLSSSIDTILASSSEWLISPQKNCQPLSEQSTGSVLKAHFAQDGLLSKCLQMITTFLSIDFPSFLLVALPKILLTRKDLCVFRRIPASMRPRCNVINLSLIRTWRIPLGVASWFFQNLP